MLTHPRGSSKGGVGGGGNWGHSLIWCKWAVVCAFGEGMVVFRVLSLISLFSILDKSWAFKKCGRLAFSNLHFWFQQFPPPPKKKNLIPWSYVLRYFVLKFPLKAPPPPNFPSGLHMIFKSLKLIANYCYFSVWRAKFTHQVLILLKVDM